MNHSLLVIGTFSIIFMVKVLPDLISVCSSQAFFPHFYETECPGKQCIMCHKQYFLALSAFHVAVSFRWLRNWPCTRSPHHLWRPKMPCVCMSYMRKIPVLRNSGAQFPSLMSVAATFPFRVKKRRLEGRHGSICLAGSVLRVQGRGG